MVLLKAMPGTGSSGHSKFIANDSDAFNGFQGNQCEVGGS